jgi:undecaprenyl-diphosphatase
LLGNETVVLWSLLVGGVLLIMFELWYGKKLNPPQPSFKKEGEYERGQETENVSYKNCLYIGLFQSVAMIPGVSRSAATILGGLWLGLKRRTIVEFSFLLAVPTMLAATGVDLIKSAGQFSLAQWDFLAVGFLAAFVVAAISIKWLLDFVKKHTFIPFGIYRIAITVLFCLYVIIN